MARTVWVTGYALTQGIFSVEVEDIGQRGLVKDVRSGVDLPTTCYTKREYSDTEEKARQVAVVMAKKKLASLEKQRAKIEELIRAWSETVKGTTDART